MIGDGTLMSPFLEVIGDVAEPISRWLCQNGVEVIRAIRKGGRSSVRALVQSDIGVTNLFEDQDGYAVGPIPRRLSNDVVPQATKFVLQFGKGVVYIKLGKRRQNPRRPGTGANGLANQVE